MAWPAGYLVRTFNCGECNVPHKMTVHADGPDDPTVIDRFRLLAASAGCVIDLNDQYWCEEHKAGAAC